MNPADVPDDLLSLYGRNYLGSSPAVAARRAMAAVIPEIERRARAQVMTELFGPREDLAAREAEARQRTADDTVRLCEMARPGEHARQVRERAAEEIFAKAEEFTDTLTGPRASFRRGLEAAARHILPAPTPQEITDAIARGDAVFCNPKGGGA